MATKVELPKEIVKTAIEQAISLRNRQIKQATNELIKKALEDELSALTRAKDTLADIK